MYIGNYLQRNKAPSGRRKILQSSQVRAQKLPDQAKEIDLDITSKKDNFSACANTFAAKVQSRLIESNPDNYLRATVRNGEKVPNWPIVNTDIRKLERICGGKFPVKHRTSSHL